MFLLFPEKINWLVMKQSTGKSLLEDSTWVGVEPDTEYLLNVKLKRLQCSFNKVCVGYSSLKTVYTRSGFPKAGDIAPWGLFRRSGGEY